MMVSMTSSVAAFRLSERTSLSSRMLFTLYERACGESYCILDPLRTSRWQHADHSKTLKRKGFFMPAENQALDVEFIELAPHC